MHKPNALVIDFFAGSGTTLHAINLLNVEDGGRRRCIMVTNNEISADESEELTAQGYQPGDCELENLGIARYVTWPRTVCSIKGNNIEGTPLAGTYGCDVEQYIEIEGEVTDSETGERIRGKVYKKVKPPAYPDLADLKPDTAGTNLSLQAKIRYGIFKAVVSRKRELFAAESAGRKGSRSGHLVQNRSCQPH